MDIKEIDGGNVTVIYHANCTDGFCAAWLFHQTFMDARFIAMQPNQPIESVEDIFDRHVFVVDLSFSWRITSAMIGTAKTFICLDHHKTAAEKIGDLPGCFFDMERSGAQMAWDYLCKQDWSPIQGSRHWLVEYTADRDLWKWELEGSRFANDFIRNLDFDFETWSMAAEAGKEFAILEGRSISQYLARKSAKVVKKANRVLVEAVDKNGFRHLLSIPAVNETNNDLTSDVAGQLAVKHNGIGMTYYHDGEQYRYSIRSTKETDISWIAEHFGGGGHKNAAGFARKDPFPLCEQ